MIEKHSYLSWYKLTNIRIHKNRQKHMQTAERRKSRQTSIRLLIETYKTTDRQTGRCGEGI